MGLRLTYFNTSETLPPRAVLGQISFGTGQLVAMPVLVGVGPVHELWLSDHDTAPATAQGITCAKDADFLLGVVELAGGAKTSIEAVTQDAYERLFSLLRESGYPNLFRVWNYLPDITGDANGMERYRRFNIGRFNAFEAARYSTDHPPAASGVGTLDGEPAIYFLATKLPVTPIENPRQISAYHYPEAYGPRSPTFSRAAICGGHLAISGTASIVGHESRHHGDIAAQMQETLENLRVLLAEAAKHGLELAPDQLQYKVYIRHPGDLMVVSAALRDFAPKAIAVFLQAQICRTELLVEIEAFG